MKMKGRTAIHSGIYRTRCETLSNEKRDLLYIQASASIQVYLFHNERAKMTVIRAREHRSTVITTSSSERGESQDPTAWQSIC